MSSHAAFRPDSDLLPRAADGDGVAALALLERHGRSLWWQAATLTGDRALALAAVARTFADLLAGAERPAGPAVAWLHAAVAARAAALAPGAIPASAVEPLGDMATHDDLVAALAGQLPPVWRDALLAAEWAEEAAPAPPPIVPEAGAHPPMPGTFGPAAYALAALEEPRRAAPPEAVATRPAVGAGGRRAASPGRSLDRYIERPSPLRWAAPLALGAVLAVLWAWWPLLGRNALAILFPDASPTPTIVAALPTAKWPTLPPRATRVLAQQEPAATVAPPPTETPRPTVAIARTPAPLPGFAGATATPAPPPPPATTAAPVEPTPTPTRAAPTLAPPTRTPTPRPPDPTATRVVANPPWLVLATQSLAFGVEVGPRALTFTNSGGVPLNWRVVADSTWIDLGQASGTVPPGGTQSVAIAIARGDLPTGAYTGILQVHSDGGEGLVPVAMAVSPSNTTISAFAAPTAPIGALGCADPTTYPVSAAIAGNRPPQKATLYFAINGGTQQTKDLTAAGDGRYGATLGPFTEAGTVLYSLVITEADGTIVRSASNTLQVLGCPTQVQVVPVVPPVTQPFALGGGGHTIYTFAVTQPGTLQVSLRWKGGAQRLSTLLYGPRRIDQPYEQRTGVGALAWAFPVTDEDVAAGGTWALHLVNYEEGEANGTFELTFTPLGQPRPTITPSPGPSPTPGPAAPAAPTATPAPSPTRPAPAGSPTLPRPATPGVP